MEVEREFMDAFSVVISSGYFLEQEDFYNLLRMLKVSQASEYAVERAKLLEFFTQAAEIFEFDQKVTN